MQTTSIRIVGYVVGQIWWPVGAECYKPINYDVLRESDRYTSKPELRDHLLRITSDGDFQNASVVGEVIIEMRDGRRKVSRSWPLSRFPSIADCLHPDGDDWFPMDNSDDE